MALPRRRHPGLRRRARPAARRDRLLAVARPPLRARRPGQSRPRHRSAMLRRLRGLGDGGDLRARQPRLAPARRRRRRAPARTAATRSTTSSTRPTARPGSHWLRQRRMAVFEQGWLMLHAGVVPQWDLAHDARAGRRARAERCASASRASSWPRMFGNEPRALERRARTATTRLRFTLNTLTRMRFVADDGTLEFTDQGRRRRRARRASARGSTSPAGAPPACRSRSATGRRSAWSSATTCSASTPAASGAASSPRRASTARAARSSRSAAPGAALARTGSAPATETVTS